MNKDENNFSSLVTELNSETDTIKQKINLILTHSKRILENVDLTRKAHYNEISKLERWQFILDINLIILCNSVIVTLLNWHQAFLFIPGILCPVLGTISYTKFLPKRIENFRKAAANYDYLKDDLEMFINVEIPPSNNPILLGNDLKKIIKKKQELNKDSPHFSRRSYEKAEKDMHEGRTTYRVDK